MRGGLLLEEDSLCTSRDAGSAQHSKAKPAPSVRLSLRMSQQHSVNKEGTVFHALTFSFHAQQVPPPYNRG